jgi:phenylacetate-CoA ligase
MHPQELQRAFYEMLLESQYWSPAQLVDYQRTQLAQLLRHARKNVPFYERRLDPVFTASGDIDWDRWEEIPIVTRADMATHRDAMLAVERPKGHGAVGTIASSGSTGQPIQITNNWLVTIANNASRWRAHHWHGLDWSATYTARYGANPAARYPHGLDRGPWGPAWDSAAQQGRVLELHSDASMAENAEFLKRTGSRYYSTGSKTLHVLALEVERLGLDLRLHYVLSHGERLDEADKAAVARVLGARTLEHYSSKEGGQMAHPCELDRGLHVNAENLLVEIVNAEGRGVPAGTTGRVVVTPFVSTAQPLIRYDQGDIASFGPPCSCGRHLPVLARVEGRSFAMFTHPDGRKVVTMFNNDARELLGCTFWQIAQVGPLQFEVRYVPRDWSMPGNHEAAAEMFRGNFFADAEVRFARVPEIPLTAAGKYLEYVNEWNRGR